jgi:lipopolysaccharide transport system ATP-binding protein
LIYAPATQQTALVREYKAAQQSGSAKKLAESSPAPNHNKPDGNKSGITKPPPARSPRGKQNNIDYFDPGLVPVTTIDYPSQGARIHSFRILSLDGRAVNVLVPGQDYTFEMTGEFLAAHLNIYFGMHIRSISGTIITGQRYPEGGNFIEKVQADDKFKLTFGFKMILRPDVYFVGGGVWSSQDTSCLHRILDAAMFRVDASQKTFSFGYVNAASAPAHLEIT